MTEPDTETQSQSPNSTNSAPVPNGDAQPSSTLLHSPACLKEVETNSPVPSKQAEPYNHNASTVLMDDDDEESETEEQADIHHEAGPEELERNHVKSIESFDIPDVHHNNMDEEHTTNSHVEILEDAHHENKQDDLGPAFTSMSTIDDAESRIGKSYC